MTHQRYIYINSLLIEQPIFVRGYVYLKVALPNLKNFIYWLYRYNHLVATIFSYKQTNTETQGWFNLK